MLTIPTITKVKIALARNSNPENLNGVGCWNQEAFDTSVRLTIPIKLAIIVPITRPNKIAID